MIDRRTYAIGCELLGLTPMRDPWSPAARTAQLPPWLSAELLQTAPAREKLRAWAAATPAEDWSTPLDPADVYVRLAVVGDEPLGRMLACVIAQRIPRPVSDFAITQCLFVTCGRQVLGFCSAPLDQGARPFLVVLTAGSHETDVATFENLVAHELSHVWLLAPPAGTVAAGTLWQGAVYDLPLTSVPDAALDRVAALRDEYARGERQAIALAKSWGFNDVA